MGQRVKIGKISGSTYGIQVTKPGKSFTDSPAPTSKDMLFDSTKVRTGQIYAGGQGLTLTSTGKNWKTGSGTTKADLGYIPLITLVEKNTGFTESDASDDAEGYEFITNISQWESTADSVYPISANANIPSSSGTGGDGNNRNTFLASAPSRGRSYGVLEDDNEVNCLTASFFVLRIPCAFGYMNDTYFQLPSGASSGNDRVLIGKNVNTNHGHSTSSPGYGVYVSRPGKDVKSCTADELVFNTDNGTGTSLARVIGMFQLAPIDTNNNTTPSNFVNGGATVNINISSVNFNLGLGFTAFGGQSVGAVDSSSNSTNFSFSSNTANNTISITNNTNTSVTTTAFVVPTISSSAVF